MPQPEIAEVKSYLKLQNFNRAMWSWSSVVKFWDGVSFLGRKNTFWSSKNLERLFLTVFY